MVEALRAKKVIIPALLLAAGATACEGGKTQAQVPDKPSLSQKPSATVNIGYDVSFPQCGAKLPDAAKFAIVGLNGTLANNFNNCFLQEEKWAEGFQDNSSLGASLYVHFANPGPSSPNWPKQGHNRYGNCTGGDSQACAYQYGENLAEGDIKAEHPVIFTGQVNYFVDMETNYSYEPKKQNNLAVLEGMTEIFGGSGGRTGIYSNASEWAKMVGHVPASSEVHGAPDWVLGAHNLSEAKALCRQPGFTGQVLLTQMAGENINKPFDENIDC